MPIAVGASTGRSVVIVDGVRTPFAKAGGALADVPAHELGRVAVRELLARTELDPARVDEVVLGNCGTPAEAANIAACSALEAGVPRAVPAFTRAPQLRLGHRGDRPGGRAHRRGLGHDRDRGRHRVDVELPAPAWATTSRRRSAPPRAGARCPRGSRPSSAFAPVARPARRHPRGPDRPGERPQHGPDGRGAGARVRRSRARRRTRSRSSRTGARSRPGTRAGSRRRSRPSTPRPRSRPWRRTSARGASRRWSRSPSSSRSSTAATARSRSATPARSPTAPRRSWSWTRRRPAPRATARSAASAPSRSPGSSPSAWGSGRCTPRRWRSRARA